MYKSDRKSWINEYGYDEGYTSKYLRSYLSGHLYRGSAMETDSSCGNCDGGNCDSCREMFEVFECGEPIFKETEYGWKEQYENVLEHRIFSDKQEALEYYESIK